MKKLIFTVILTLCTLVVFAQEEIKVSNFDASKVEQIDLQFEYPELVSINTWDQNEVKITADIFINDGEDNENFKLSSKLRNGVLVIESDIKNIDGYSNYMINRDNDDGMHITRNGTTISKNGRWRRNSIVISVRLEIMIPEGMDVKVDARYGIVEVLSNDISLDIEARYGGIDIMVDEKMDLDILAKTQWGQIYHNLDTKLRADGEGAPGKWMRTEASLNRGTKKLHAESQYGNVYLRKNN
jgi:hypothetical protein